MSKNFKKLKNCAKKYKFAFLASGCSSIARNGDVHRGLMEGVAARGGRGRGCGKRRGSTVEGSSTSKNRPSQHKYRFQQFELKQS